MDAEKRKRQDGGEVDEKKTRLDNDKGGVIEPNDDEVEEFFAILRRIRVAVEYFREGNGEGGRRELTGKGSSSRRSMSFEMEDFQEVDGVKGPVDEEVDTGLDLNAEPDSEPNPLSPDVKE